MGVSTDGELSYGVIFDEDDEFPWDEHGDEEAWWRDVNEYKCPLEWPFDENGEWLDVPDRESKASACFAHQREWMKANPMPFRLVNACSGDYPQWIVAMPGIGFCARRGYPVKIDGLPDVDPTALQKLKSFLKDFLDCDEEPGWVLSSYWG